jgi:hypothetical protein
MDIFFDPNDEPNNSVPDSVSIRRAAGEQSRIREKRTIKSGSHNFSIDTTNGDSQLHCSTISMDSNQQDEPIVFRPFTLQSPNSNESNHEHSFDTPIRIAQGEALQLQKQLSVTLDINKKGKRR